MALKDNSHEACTVRIAKMILADPTLAKESHAFALAHELLAAHCRLKELESQAGVREPGFDPATE